MIGLTGTASDGWSRIVAALRRLAARRRWRPWILAGIVFAATAVLAATLIWLSERQRLHGLRADVGHLTAVHADMLQRSLENNLFAAYAVAALIRQKGGIPADFDAYARDLMRFYPLLVILHLAPDGVVRQVAPRAGNEAVIGLDLFKDRARSREAILARDSGQLTMAGPYDLVIGGRGVVGRLPVFLADDRGHDRFWGLVSVTVRFPEGLEAGRLALLEAQGFGYSLWRTHPETQDKEIIAASPAHLDAPVTQVLTVPNAIWHLSVAPLRGWGDPAALASKIALGLAFSLLSAMLSKLLTDARTHAATLEALVLERTAEIRAREADLSRAEAVAGIGSWVEDFGTGETRASPESYRVAGLSQDRPFSVEDFLARVHPADREAVARAWLGARDGTGYELEHRLQVVGQTRWVRHLAEIERGADGAPLRAIVTVQDINERKLAQDALRLVLTKYKTLFESFPLGIAVADASGQIREANEKAQRLLGLQGDKLGLRRIDGSEWRILRPDGSPMPPEEFASVRAQKERRLIAGVEMGVAKPSGEMAWLRVTAAPLPSVDDGVVIAFDDITERLQTDRDLRIAATVFEAQEGMLVTDANNIILRVNHAFCATTGYSQEEVVGKTPRFFQSGRHDRDFYVAMWERISRTGGWQGEVWNRRKNGEIYPEWLTITAVKDRAGAITNFIGTHTDITQRKAAENEIRNLAYYDPLTQLPNRRLLMDRLQQTLANSARSQRQGALLFIDLDNFKTLNDTHGHEVGDRLLQQVAQRLNACVREVDTVARLGGDEFVVMLQGLGTQAEESANAARIVGEKVRESLTQPYQLNGLTHRSTPSIGVVLFGGQAETIDELLRHADIAMYQAKAAGRNQLCFFDPAMQSALAIRASLETDLRLGLQSGQLMLHYQAQVDDRDRLLGAEALVRWLHPQHGWVAPGEIIQLAEATGQMLPLSLWILQTACAQLASWATRPDRAHLTLAVNISPRQFRHPNFVSEVLGVLADSGVEPGRLMLELPESLLVEDPAETAIADDRPQGPGGWIHAGQLRHRLLFPGVPQASAARPDQDRPRLRQAHPQPSQQRGHRPSLHGPSAGSGTGDPGGGRGNGGATRLPEPPRLPDLPRVPHRASRTR